VNSEPTGPVDEPGDPDDDDSAEGADAQTL
jgi:hypothetical protein